MDSSSGAQATGQARGQDSDDEATRPEVVVAHNRLLAGVTCGVAVILTLAWLSRLIVGGSAWEWIAVLVLSMIAGIEFAVLRDARFPLLIADHKGIRLRHGAKWQGLPWSEIETVSLTPRSGLLADGSVKIVPADGSVEWSLPLSVTTKVNQPDLIQTFRALAAGRTEIVGPVQDSFAQQDSAEPTVPTPSSSALAAESEPPEPSALPGRPRLARPPRWVKRVDSVDQAAPEFGKASRGFDKAASEFVGVPRQRTDSLSVVELAQSADARVDLAAVDDDAEPPGSDQTTMGAAGINRLGIQLAAARIQSGLSIQQLSERTQIRPHVIAQMEAGDFSQCGGDFYARGHLRTLGRRLGLDQRSLIKQYDDDHAQAPIEVRQVFEVDLAEHKRRGLRLSLGGHRWGLLAVTLVAIGAVWTGLQIIEQKPREVLSPAPNVVDSVGLRSQQEELKPQASIATLTVKAVGGASDVVIRDKDGRIIWADRLNAGQSHRVFGHAPFNVAASHASRVQLSLLGKHIGKVGAQPRGGDRTVNLPVPQSSSPN